jgi:LacI family transcriptional regulator
MVMDDLSRFCCLNPACPDVSKRAAGNLTVCGSYGKHETFRLLYCRTCRARFGERKGTPLFNSRLPSAKSLSVLEHVAEGCGVRQTSRLVKVNRGTVGRLSKLAGGQAKALHDELVAFSPADTRGAVGRKVGVCGQEAGQLRPSRGALR